MFGYVSKMGISIFVRQMETRARGYKTFSCSTQLRLKFILLINVKMPIVGIFNIYEKDKLVFFLVLNWNFPPFLTISTFMSS